MPPKKNPGGNPTRNAVTLFSILLFSGRAHSLKRLAEILDCSRQTVLRLIEQIEMSGRANIRKWTQDGQSFYQTVILPNRNTAFPSPNNPFPQGNRATRPVPGVASAFAAPGDSSET